MIDMPCNLCLENELPCQYEECKYYNLEKAKNEYDEKISHYKWQIKDSQEHRDSLQASLTTHKDLLLRTLEYMAHHTDCQWYLGDDCSCGLDDLIKDIKKLFK